LASQEPGSTYLRNAQNSESKSSALPTSEHGSYNAILASDATAKTAGVMPRSVLDLMHWPTPVQTHLLGPVETLLVYRKPTAPTRRHSWSFTGK
ncbi:hypothetical protein ACCT11_35705, partial [Rhizobium johnstonii]